jgi:quercetin dioxygenase-like cupin family protein
MHGSHLRKSDMAQLPPLNDKSGFRTPRRYTTTHDNEGVSKFIPDHVISTKTQWEEILPGMFHFLSWGTTTSPAQMTDDADVKAYELGSIKSTEPVTPNGTNVRLFDFAPEFETKMHRTYSIDYGIVIHGSIESHMDGGEVRIGNPGDIFIQRGTNHLWRNPSKTEWTRMYFVVVAADPLTVKGRDLEELKFESLKQDEVAKSQF